MSDEEQIPEEVLDEIRARIAATGKTPEELLEEVRKEEEPIEHLYCGHCGGIEDVIGIDLRPRALSGMWVRWLCINCRDEILKWI